MILREITEQLALAAHPVARAVLKEGHRKVLFIAFKKSHELKEHVSHTPATLYVLNGAVIYRQGTAATELFKYDEAAIPANTPHTVECTAEALCLLIQ